MHVGGSVFALEHSSNRITKITFGGSWVQKLRVQPIRRGPKGIKTRTGCAIIRFQLDVMYHTSTHYLQVSLFTEGGFAEGWASEFTVTHRVLVSSNGWWPPSSFSDICAFVPAHKENVELGTQLCWRPGVRNCGALGN